MAGWSKNTHAVQDRGLGGGKRTRSIEGAVLHHVAGTNGLSYVANRNNRNSHPTYHVSNSGRVTGIVHPDRRPYSTAHSVDNVAITFEIDNERAGGDWPISDAAMESVLETILDHARQGGYTRFVKNTPGKDQPGAFFIAWHSQYHATACPGPYITGKLDWIISELNRRISGSTKPAQPAKPAATGYRGIKLGSTSPSAPENRVDRWVKAPGGEPGAPMWPVGPLMARVQAALKNRGRYNGDDDGVGAKYTAIGVQKTLNISQLNGRRPYIPTVEDGKLGINNSYGVQHYGAKHGDYVGPVDGDPRTNSWIAFALGLERH